MVGNSSARWILIVLLVFACSCPAQNRGAPFISRIDPPNWWPALPDPMLLVYGGNLKGARFDVEGSRVRIKNAQSSDNGTYAFLWLETSGAPPQRLRIRARNLAGQTSIEFDLKARKAERGGRRGVGPADVIYLIMTDRFADGDPSNNQPGYAPEAARGWHGGDFRGIDAHLDYLQQLGVTTLWLTPILSNGNMPDSYHGYASVDLYAVDSHFGTLSDYLKLVDHLHARGMKIVFDIVPNHIGVQHPWVKNQPMEHWLNGTLEQHAHARYNLESLADPHASPADWWDIVHGWFTDSMPDLNQENPMVSKYLIEEAVWWIETAGLDGLRIDTFPYVGRAFWQDFDAQLHILYPQLTTVGEVFNGDAKVTSFFAGGVAHDNIDTGLYTPFDFPMYFALRDVLIRDEPMTKLAAVLAEDHLYPHPERLVSFVGNHDTRRFLSEPGASPERLKLALALLLTLRGTPQLYSGDEIALMGGDDPDNRRDFPGGFKNSSHDAFTDAGRSEAERRMFSWASGLLHVRGKYPEIFSGEQQNLMSDATAIAYLRGGSLAHGCQGHAERILVVASKSVEPRTVELATDGTGLKDCTAIRKLFPDTAPAAIIQNGKITIPMAATGVAIYAVQ